MSPAFLNGVLTELLWEFIPANLIPKLNKFGVDTDMI
jgi:hypothetical protein